MWTTAGAVMVTAWRYLPADGTSSLVRVCPASRRTFWARARRRCQHQASAPAASATARTPAPAAARARRGRHATVEAALLRRHGREPAGAQGRRRRARRRDDQQERDAAGGATAIGSDTALAQIVNLAQQAQNSKAPAQRLADRAASWLVLVALGGGVLTFLIWAVIAGRDAGQALLFAITVACDHLPGRARSRYADGDHGRQRAGRQARDLVQERDRAGAGGEPGHRRVRQDRHAHPRPPNTDAAGSLPLRSIWSRPAAPSCQRAGHSDASPAAAILLAGRLGGEHGMLPGRGRCHIRTRRG